MIPEWLSLIDAAFAALALLFALGGLQKGFASQIAHILTFLTMGLLLFFAYPYIFSYMGRLFRNLNETYTIWILMAGLVVLMIVFYIFVSKLLANALKLQISDSTDRIWGFSFGFVRGALATLLAMVLLVILGSDKFYDVFNEKSRVGQLVCREMVPRIQPHVNRKSVGDKIDRLREALISQEEAGLPDE